MKNAINTREYSLFWAILGQSGPHLVIKSLPRFCAFRPPPPNPHPYLAIEASTTSNHAESVLSGILQVIKRFLGPNYNEFLASNTTRQGLEMCGKHTKCPEPGPYGSVWADNCSQTLPRALGSLWDASRTPKPPQGAPWGPKGRPVIKH